MLCPVSLAVQTHVPSRVSLSVQVGKWLQVGCWQDMGTLYLMGLQSLPGLPAQKKACDSVCSEPGEETLE